VALSAAPTSLTFENVNSAPQTVTISGGQGPYSVQTQSGNASSSINNTTLTVTPTGVGSSENVVVQDSTTPTALTVSIPITVTNSAMLALPDAMTFTTSASPAASTAISGGVGPYSIATIPSSGVATSALSGSTLTVTPVGPGATEVYVKDSEGTPQSEAISIVVGSATTVLWPDVRVTVWDAFFSEVLCLDAVLAGDLGMDSLTYEDTPSGCGAGSLTVSLSLADITARGYYRAYNFVEISTADMLLTTACASGATKIYVDSNKPVDPSTGEDGQQLYMWDGVNLTMLIPVVGIGSDSGGNYITIGTPVATPGNPSTLPAYGVGTYVGRRRYCGRIIRRSRPNQRTPKATIQLVGLGSILSAYGTFTITNVDAGTAIYNTLAQFASRWPFLTINSGNFPTIGWSYSGMQTNYSALQMVSDICATVPTGDLWVVRIGHDRVPRLIRLYISATNTYVYNVTLPQGVTNFEPLTVEIDDEDASNLYNAVQVTASNTLSNQSSNAQPAAIVDDSTSISIYGQVDAMPVTQTGLSTQEDCINYGTSLLNQYSLAVSNNQFRVYTRNESSPANMPAGFANGDVVRGVDCVTISRFSDTGTIANMIPDSEFIYGPAQVDAFSWTTTSAGVSVSLEGGHNQSNALAIAGTGASQTVAVGSLPIDIFPGQTYTLSIWINAQSCTSGSAQAAVFASVNGAWYGSAISGTTVTQAYGNYSQLTATFTIPSNATYAQVSVVLMTDTAITPTSHYLLFSQPQLQLGEASSSYVENAAAPNVYGLVASAQTTIDPRGDRWQDVKFAAIEPDWNAAIAERGRAIANAVLLNTPTPVSITSYCVSDDAYPSGGISISGLTVTPPAFLAIFAQGQPVITVSSAPFTLEPTATNWAWLNSNGTWTVNQNPATVAGAILYGYFQTSATAVLGYTETAPIGVVKIGVGNINVAANLSAPTTSSVTVANTSTPTSLAADVAANLTVTNVPQNGAAWGLAYYYRTHGSASWVPYGELTFTGLPEPSSSITMPQFVYGQLQNGIAYDYAVGFVGLAGYGPLTTIASNVTATAIVVTTPYMIGTTSPTPTVTSVSVTNGTSANGVAAAITLNFTLTNQPTDGSLSRISIWFRVHSATTWSTSQQGTFYVSEGVPGLPTPTATQAYTIVLADITNGQNYDFAVTYENAQGADSANVGIIYSNWAAVALNLPTSSLPGIPSGTTMTATGSITGYAGDGAAAGVASFSVTPTITSTLPFADWGAGFMILAKINNTGTIDGDANPLDYFESKQLPTTTWTNSTALTGVTGPLAAGNAYQLAVTAVDQQGQYGPVVPFALSTLITVTTSSTLLGTGNLVVDSDFTASNFNSSGIGSNNPYWAFEWIDGISFCITQDTSAQAESNPYFTGSALLQVFHGDNGRNCQAVSEVINVNVGTQYTFSGAFSLGSVSGSNTPYWAIAATNWNMSTASGTIYAQLNGVNGTNNQTQTTTWTCPSGVTQVVIVYCSNMATVAGGASMWAARPYFSASPGPYQPGPALKGVASASSTPTTDANSTGGGAVNSAGDQAGTNAHLTMSAGVQLAIDHAGNALTVQFPGGKQNASGALTNIDGVTSSTLILTPSGTTLLIEGVITAPNATGNATRGFFWGGNLSTNYYKVLWNTGGLFLTRVSGGTGTTLVTAASAPAYDANPHSVQIACLYNGSTSNTIEVSIDGVYNFAYVDTSPPSPPASINIQAYTGGLAGTLSNFFVSASGTTYTSLPVAVRGAVMQPNLVVNGNNMDGQGTVGPTQYGWTTTAAVSTAISGGTYAVNGQSYTAMQIEATSSGGFIGQTINVVPGQTYTYCLLMNSGVGGQADIYIGNTALTSRFNSSPGAPSGSLGAYYGGATADINGTTQTVNSVWQAFYGTFTVPNGNYQAVVLLRSLATTGYAFFSGVQVIQGTRLQDYHDAEPAGLVAGKGNALATASTMFNALTPNIPNWTTNLVLHYASSGTSPNISMAFYYDDGTAATDATIYNPDGSSVNVGHSTSGAPTTTLSSLSTGATVYYLMYYERTSAPMVIVAQTSAFTLTQINAAYADGGYVAFNATTSTTGTGISAGGSGGITGGGIGNHNRY
jgi:Carbohydrate binding domain